MTSPRRQPITVGLLLALPCLAPSVSADLITVGPTGDYTEIQPAIDAAIDGDVVLIDTGTYGPVTIGDLTVTVTADRNTTALIQGGITVSNLSADRTVVLAGLTGTCIWTDHRDTLELLDNAGVVRVENCVLTGSGGYNVLFDIVSGRDAVRVERCDQVALTACLLTGGFGMPGGTGARGVHVVDGEVTIYSCRLDGGVGVEPPTLFAGGQGDGGAAASLDNAIVFVSDSPFKGGDGARGLDGDEWSGGTNGGDGGAGIEVIGAGTILRRLDSSATGGDGGEGGGPGLFAPGGHPGDPGPPLLVNGGQVVEIAGPSYGFAVPSPGREFETVDMHFLGDPGDLAAVFWGLHVGSFYKANWHGQVLMDFGQPVFLILLGQVPPGGDLVVPLAFEDMGPGWEALTFHWQSVFRSAGGQITLGPPRAQVLIDASL